eukprot:6192705-Pleurochrysis_carterae.AAC.1
MAALRREMIELAKRSQASDANNSAKTPNAEQQSSNEPAVVNLNDPARQDAEKNRKKKKWKKTKGKRCKHSFSSASASNSSSSASSSDSESS